MNNACAFLPLFLVELLTYFHYMFVRDALPWLEKLEYVKVGELGPEDYGSLTIAWDLAYLFVFCHDVGYF